MFFCRARNTGLQIQGLLEKKRASEQDTVLGVFSVDMALHTVLLQFAFGDFFL